MIAHLYDPVGVGCRQASTCPVMYSYGSEYLDALRDAPPETAQLNGRQSICLRVRTYIRAASVPLRGNTYTGVALLMALARISVHARRDRYQHTSACMSARCVDGSEILNLYIHVVYAEPHQWLAEHLNQSIRKVRRLLQLSFVFSRGEVATRVEKDGSGSRHRSDNDAAGASIEDNQDTGQTRGPSPESRIPETGGLCMYTAPPLPLEMSVS